MSGNGTGLTSYLIGLMNDSLGDMPSEEFRQDGYQLIDWIADFLANIDNLPALPNVQPGDISGKLPNAPPIKGEAMDEILADVDCRSCPEWSVGTIRASLPISLHPVAGPVFWANCSACQIGSLEIPLHPS